MRPEPTILAIDLGTTEAKGGLVTLDGHLLGLARARCPILIDTHTGHAEQNAETWWTATVDVVRSLHAANPGAQVLAIVVDGHGPTTTAVDGDGRPTRPALTWLDGRSAAEQAELEAASGLRGWALGVTPAALWIERHEPAVAARTRWYLNTWEWLGLRLTGRAATSLVPRQRLPSDAIMTAVGLRPERLAPPIAMGDILGPLRADAAAALGLREATPVVAGHVDAFSTFLGAGLRAPGDALDAGGTAGGFGVYVDHPIVVPGTYCTPAPLEGLHILGGGFAATGKALDWFRDGIVGGGATTEALIAEAVATPPGADGVVFLPYLAGERAPIHDPDARGMFAGLTLAHGRGHLARAILEAAAFAIRHVAEPVLSAGIPVNSMRVCGGPARSEAWNQIKADVTGFSIDVPAVAETAVVGSAIIGAVGSGAFDDLPQAIAAMSRIARTIEPRGELVEIYDRTFRAYTALHPAAAPVLRPLIAAANPQFHGGLLA
ncbi:MAG: FGGY-family carbohydrate kinase [Chloroflexota bacterium]